MPYAITVNGVARTVDVDDDTPVLWVLRDVLRMNGTKFGCGLGLCGACTIHLDGKPVRSCVTPIAAAAGKRVTTIEAIGATAAGHFRRRREPDAAESDANRCPRIQRAAGPGADGVRQQPEGP